MAVLGIVNPQLNRRNTLFKTKAANQNQPLASATAIDYYYPGENVHYDQILEKDGYKWLSYTAYNGSRRYIQLEGLTSSQNYQNQSGNSSNYGSNNSSTVGWKKIMVVGIILNQMGLNQQAG